MKNDSLILSIKGLSVHYKIYEGFLNVLDNINFNVAYGERIGLIGETGCGKTTTMKTIMRLLPSQAVVPNGKIFFQGKNVLGMNQSKINKYLRKKAVMIFQDPTASLNPVFTIGTQINDVIRNLNRKENHKNKIYEESIGILKDVSLPDPERIMINYPFQLSGGMRQRICIALAVSCDPILLIADEPTTSLDVTIQAQILDLISELVERRKTSLILITHSLGITRGMTDRIYVMYAGTIVETSKTESFYKNPLHPYSQGLLASVPKLSGGGFADGIPGHIPNYLNTPLGCRFSPRCSRALPICYTKKPPLFKVEYKHKVACFLYKNYKEERYNGNE